MPHPLTAAGGLPCVHKRPRYCASAGNRNDAHRKMGPEQISAALEHRSRFLHLPSSPWHARSLPQVLGHRFAAGMDMELSIDAFDMRSNGINADRERGSDFLVRHPPGEMV